MRKLLLLLLLVTALCFSLQTASFAAIEQDTDGFYKISTSADLKEFTELVNRGYLIANAKLMNDIVLSSDISSCDWTEVGPIGTSANREYLGILDGGGYTIKGLYMNRASGNTGLVGILGKDGVIRNLTITGDIQATGSNTGAFAGTCKGQIINCVNRANVTSAAGLTGGIAGGGDSAAERTTIIKNCLNSGKVSAAGGAVGGIIGSLSNYRSVENCVNTGDVSSTSSSGIGGIIGNANSNAYVGNCVNTGDVNASTSSKWGGASNVGGIAGSQSSGSETANCVSTGNVIAVKHPDDTGNSTGKYIGGIVGNPNGTVTNCFWLKSEAISPDHGLGGNGGHTVGTDVGTTSRDAAENLPAAAILLDSYAKIGHTFALTATAYPTVSGAASNLVVITSEDLTLSPSNIRNSESSVMTVATGIIDKSYDAAVSVSAETAATAEITPSVAFTVTPSAVAAESISISHKTLALNVGASAQLKATVLPNNTTNPSVSWSSDKETVATVDKDGNVAAVAVGKAIITVTTADGSKSDSCEVTVSQSSSGSSSGCSAGVGALALLTLVPLLYYRKIG